MNLLQIYITFQMKTRTKVKVVSELFIQVMMLLQKVLVVSFNVDLYEDTDDGEGGKWKLFSKFFFATFLPQHQFGKVWLAEVVKLFEAKHTPFSRVFVVCACVSKKEQHMWFLNLCSSFHMRLYCRLQSERIHAKSRRLATTHRETG